MVNQPTRLSEAHFDIHPHQLIVLVIRKSILHPLNQARQQGPSFSITHLQTTFVPSGIAPPFPPSHAKAEKGKINPGWETRVEVRSSSNFKSNHNQKTNWIPEAKRKGIE